MCVCVGGEMTKCSDVTASCHIYNVEGISPIVMDFTTEIGGDPSVTGCGYVTLG